MEDMERILRKLKGDGHRITKARSAIIDFLLNNRLPLTASSICKALESEGLKSDRATVYRELDFLLANNVVRQVRFTGQATHYEIDSDHHHHLICVKCKSVKEVVLEECLEDHERQIYREEKFKVFSHSLEFYGLCNTCVGDPA